MLIAVVLLVVAVLAAAVFGARWWTWRPVVRHRMLVVTDEDVTFEGVVLSRRGPILVLGDVKVTAAGGTHQVDGQVIVERSRVLWLQRVA